MARSLSKNLISPSVFITKPNDALATLDVYTKNNGQIVNKIQDIARLFDVDSTNIMKGGALISRHFPVITSKLNETIAINSENLVARISSISRNVSSTIGRLSSSFKETVSNLPVMQDVYSVIDGVKSKVGDVDFSGLKPIVDTIKEVAADPNIIGLVDHDSEAALYIGLISEASRNGIANSYGSIVGALDNPLVRNNVIRNVLPFAIDTSDVRMLKSILDSDSSRNSLLDTVSLISDFSNRYQYGYGYDDNQEYEEFNTLYSTYSSIDPYWNKKTVILDDTETDILDISKITDSSKDFKESLLNYFKIKDDGTNDELFMVLASAFEKTTVEEKLKQMLPFLVLHEAFNQF